MNQKVLGLLLISGVISGIILSIRVVYGLELLGIELINGLGLSIGLINGLILSIGLVNGLVLSI